MRFFAVVGDGDQEPQIAVNGGGTQGLKAADGACVSRPQASELTAIQLGDIIEFNSTYDRYRPTQPPAADPTDSAAKKNPTWKEAADQGNETIYNLGSHIIDQAYMLFGMPEKVYCRVWDMRGTGLAEAVSVSIHFSACSLSHLRIPHSPHSIIVILLIIPILLMPLRSP